MMPQTIITAPIAASNSGLFKPRSASLPDKPPITNTSPIMMFNIGCARWLSWGLWIVAPEPEVETLLVQV